MWMDYHFDWMRRAARGSVYYDRSLPQPIFDSPWLPSARRASRSSSATSGGRRPLVAFMKPGGQMPVVVRAKGTTAWEQHLVPTEEIRQDAGHLRPRHLWRRGDDATLRPRPPAAEDGAVVPGLESLLKEGEPGVPLENSETRYSSKQWTPIAN